MRIELTKDELRIIKDCLLKCIVREERILEIFKKNTSTSNDFQEDKIKKYNELLQKINTFI
jgi:hypothetical protein